MSTKPNTNQITYDSGSNKQDLNNILDTVVPITDYDELRGYSGRATTVRITSPGIAGFFQYDSTDTASTDNGGTVIVANTNRWKRVFDGTVNVKWFGILPNTDCSAAIQSALNTSKAIVIPEGEYLAANLIGTMSGQTIRALGKVTLRKNAHGPIITHSGDYVEFDGIAFASVLTDVWEGDNVISTGNHPRFINCASTGATGRALKATGGHVQLLGTCGSYTTSDDSPSAYDIEIGVSGTATLYHQLVGVYTSKATGGVLLIDTGSHTLVGGQIGKLTIKTSSLLDPPNGPPNGTNGGMTANMRILGDVLVERSAAIFTGNQFSVVNVKFEIKTSGCRLDASNTFASGATIVNNGNANNFIEREIAIGSITKLKYGDDLSTAVIEINQMDTTAQWGFSGSAIIPNNRGLKSVTTSGEVLNLANSTSSNGASFGNVSWSRTDVNGPFINFNSTAGTQVQVVDGALRPFSNNTKTLGTASLLWSTVYAGTGTINTSDERHKQQFVTLSDAEKRVAKKAKLLLKSFKFNDAVELKGDKARIHFGLSAQALKEAFESEGLVAEDYAALCYDEWPDAPAVVADDGTVIQEAVVGGNRYGVRYDELLAFIIASL